MRFAPGSLDRADWQLEWPAQPMMRDEILIEEMRKRAEVEKMDTAFCAAMLSAIDAGTEHSPEGICKEPGTRRPIVFLAS
jgi:hypothetical protein